MAARLTRKPAKPVPVAPARLVYRGAPWPTVWCGGPAQPTGPAALCVEVEVRTVSEANQRSAMAKIRRKAAQHDAVEEALSPYAVADVLMALCDVGGPWCVRLTRLASGTLDADNLPPALKAISDAVSAALGVDDGSPGYGLCWAQEKRAGTPAVRIEVWGPVTMPRAS